MKPPGLSSTSYHQSSPFSMGLATDSGTGSGLLEARLGLLCSPCHLLPRLPLGLPAVLVLGFCTLPYSAWGGVSISASRCASGVCSSSSLELVMARLRYRIYLQSEFESWQRSTQRHASNLLSFELEKGEALLGLGPTGLQTSATRRLLWEAHFGPKSDV